MIPSDPRPQFEVVDVDEDHAKGVAFNMLFMVWRRRTLASAYSRGIAIVRELSASFGEGVGVLQVVEADAIPPDSQARSAFVEFFRLQEIKHYSVTHEGSGFKAAFVRAIVAAAHTIARPKCAFSVHSLVPSAAEWHEQQQRSIGRKEQAQQIALVAQTLRALHKQKFPAR